MTRPDQARLLDILISARKAVEYVQGVDRAGFGADTLLQDAVIRRVELIGEAAGKVSLETREAIRDVPWHKISGMRNRLAHEYFRVDLDIVWQVVAVELPVVIRALESAVPREGDS